MHSLPPEVLTIIFENCDSLSQACSLSRTSSYTYRTWRECRARLAWELATKEVVASEDALMTVSALVSENSQRPRD